MPVLLREINASGHYSQLKPVKKSRTQETFPLGKVEVKKLRVIIGHMNWVTTQTRPYCSIFVSLKV